MLSPNIIIGYNSTHASIPAGWVRDTRFDGKYLKATASGWGDTGGAATHTHTAEEHTHTYTSNSHQHSTGSITGAPTYATASHQDAPPFEISMSHHVHASQASGIMATPTITAATPSIGTANNEFSRYLLIFIKSTGYNSIPANGVVFRNDTNARAGSTHLDDLNSRYLKGAGTGADAGGGTDVASHTHTQTHSHTLEHSHGDVNSGNAVSGIIGGANIAEASSPPQHSHNVAFANASEVVTNNDSLTAYDNNLAFKELHPFNQTAVGLPQVGDIALYTETVLPIGWNDLGLEDVYIKGKTSGEALTTGGALVHTHSDMSHSHTGSSHTHTWSTNGAGGTNNYKPGGTEYFTENHSHNGTTSAGTNANTGSTNLVTDSVNYEPEYIKVRFIQMQFLATGGASILKMVN